MVHSMTKGNNDISTPFPVTSYKVTVAALIYKTLTYTHQHTMYKGTPDFPCTVHGSNDHILLPYPSPVFYMRRSKAFRQFLSMSTTDQSNC